MIADGGIPPERRDERQESRAAGGIARGRMKAAKVKRFRVAGWKIGSAKEFLRLNEQEAALVEVKLCLMDALRQTRRRRGISQIELARRMGSSQSRIAKIEAGDPSVSLDLILRALVASGASRREIQDTLVSGYPG
jgi:ribosome-binding protein aMBF1 (putative translation factor)